MAGETYEVNPRIPYGPRWQRQRPPGLPATARRSGVSYSALPAIERISHELWAEAVRDCAACAAATVTFCRTVKHLALFESGGGQLDGARYALPCNSFGENTAWGVFQYNNAAWRRETRRHLVRAQRHPWEASEDEEVRIPLRQYRDVAKKVMVLGAAPIFAARAIRLYHMTPAYCDRWLDVDAPRQGVEASWEGMYRRNTGGGRVAGTLVDTRLRHAGLLE